MQDCKQEFERFSVGLTKMLVAFNPYGTALQPAAILAWWDGLNDIPERVRNDAMLWMIRNYAHRDKDGRQFPPVVAQVRERCRLVALDHEAAANLAKRGTHPALCPARTENDAVADAYFDEARANGETDMLAVALRYMRERNNFQM